MVSRYRPFPGTLRRARWLSQVPEWSLAPLPRSQTPPPRACPTVPSTPVWSPCLLMPKTGRTNTFRGSFTQLQYWRPTLRDSVVPTRARLASGCAVSLSRTGFSFLHLQGHFRKVSASMLCHLHFPFPQAFPGATAIVIMAKRPPEGGTPTAQNGRLWRWCSGFSRSSRPSRGHNYNCWEGIFAH